MPKVTVLMPVFNGEAYLGEAIQSILDQTFDDFEFLIIDDGSTDTSDEIIRTFDDRRIRTVRNEKNLGIIETLNRGIALSKGKYIARMDCDDISLPTRLEKQVNYMEAHDEIGVCGTATRRIKKRKRNKGNPDRPPLTDEKIKIQLLFSNAISHPTAMLRKDLLSIYRYPEKLKYVEDYYLWTRISDTTTFANLPDVLLYQRIHSEQTSTRKKEEQRINADLIRAEYIKRTISDVSDEEIVMLNKITNKDPDLRLEDAASCLKSVFEKNKTFAKQPFGKYLSKIWWNLCKNNNQGIYTIRHYHSFGLHKAHKKKIRHYTLFLIRNIVKPFSINF